MDDFQARGVKSVRSRHEAAARKAVKDIQDAAGWLLRDLDRGRGTPTNHARAIVSDANELLTRISQLDALNEVVPLFEDEPVTTKEA